MNRKVVILGLDALEYNVITKQSRSLLMQNEYGKIQVPIIKGQNEPSTAIVWASFFSGCGPSKHNISRFAHWNYMWLHWLDFLAQKVGIPLKVRINTGQMLRRLGFRKRPPDKTNYTGIGTIFEDIPKSLAISAPSYNEWKENFKVRHDMVSKRSAKHRWQPAEYVLQLDFKRLNQFFTNIDKMDLIMVHIFFPDIIQHLYFYNKDIIERVYDLVESILCATLSQISPETLVLVISDHGQEQGHHTPYGFYSSNADLNLSQPTIKDFRKIISSFIQNTLEIHPKEGKQIINEAYEKKNIFPKEWDQKKIKRGFGDLIRTIKDYEAKGEEVDEGVQKKQDEVRKRLESLGYL